MDKGGMHADTWASSGPFSLGSDASESLRRAGRKRPACARGVAPRRGASIAPSWPGAPCMLGAAELAAHPRSRPSSMPANHAGCSRRTRRGGAARAMARHAGHRRGSAPRHGGCVVRGRIAKAPVSAKAATDTRGVAPPAARGQVFVRLRTLRATSLCVTFDRASARTLWWVEWHQRRVCSIESQILRAFENAADRATKLQPRTLSRAVLYVFKPIPYESCVFLLTVPGCFVYVTHLFL